MALWSFTDMTNTDRSPPSQSVHPRSQVDRASDDINASVLGTRAELVSSDTFLAALDRLALLWSASRASLRRAVVALAVVIVAAAVAEVAAARTTQHT